MSQKIKDFMNLLNQLTVEDNAVKSDSFTELCTHSHPTEVNAAYEYYVERGDLQGIRILLKYLLNLRTKYSYSRMVDLTESESTVIREEAIESMKEIASDESSPLLIRMMKSQYAEVRIFAVDQLGFQRSRLAVMPIIESMEEQKDKDFRVAGLMALGNIGDDRCVAGIEKMFVSFQQDKEVLEQALTTLGMYSAYVSKRFLKRCVHSENKMIREATHLAILKLLKTKWEVFTVKGLEREHDPKIKMNILSSVRTVETRRLFLSILYLGTSDSHEGVRMMAQTVFKRIRTDKILEWLLQKEKKLTGKPKEQVLRLLVMYPQDPRVVKVYKHNSIQEKDLHLKLVAIEYMGYTGSNESIPFLRSLVISGEKYAFVASVSLSHLIRKDDQSILLEMISLDAKVNSPIVQMYLRLILRLKSADSIAEPIRDKIRELTSSSEHNIRYLALRCLSRWDCSQNLKHIIGYTVHDKSRMVRYSAKVSTAEMLSASIDRIEDFAVLIREDRRLCQVAYEVIKRIDWHRVFYREIIQGLVQSALMSTQTAVTARLMTIIRILIRDRRALFLDAFSNLEWSSEEMGLLIRVAQKAPIQTWYGLHAEQFIRIYKQSDLSVKTELLKLFSKLEIKEQILKELVFGELENTSEDILLTEAKRTVNRWIKSASGVVKHG